MTQFKWSHFVKFIKCLTAPFCRRRAVKLLHYRTGAAWAWHDIVPVHIRRGGTFFATWHFGNVVWPLLSEPECVGLQINSQLLGRQWRRAAVQSGSFLWGGIGHKGCGASRCSCCSRWEYRLARRVCVAAADAWNGTQVAGRASGFRCIFCQVITLLHWFFSLLHWSEKITGKRERERERGKKREGERAEEPLIDLVPRFNDWQQNLEWQCSLLAR